MKNVLPWVILALAIVGGYFLWMKYSGKATGGGMEPSTST